MPTPSLTSVDAIVAAGRRIVEEQGLEGLTMQRVAGAVGVRAPSLYKHVANRGELVKLIVEAVVVDLGRKLDAVVSGVSTSDLVELVRAFRSFVLDQPQSYRVVFAPMPEDWRPDQKVFTDAAAPVLRTTEAMVGSERALDAARLVTAWAHGFMTMELTGAFRIEGELDRAFEFGIDRLVAALSSG